MRLGHDRAERRGATAVETALVLMVFITLIMGMLDLTIGVLRYHVVSEAARQGVRQAIVHGKLAPPELPEWPATSADGVLADDPANHPIVAVMQPMLVNCDLSRTRIWVTRVDSSTEVERRLRVRVETPYEPIMTFIFGNPTITLGASSTMPIAH